MLKYANVPIKKVYLCFAKFGHPKLGVASQFLSNLHSIFHIIWRVRAPPKKKANPQAARLGTGDVTTASKQLGPSRCASWVWFAVPFGSLVHPWLSHGTHKNFASFSISIYLYSLPSDPKRSLDMSTSIATMDELTGSTTWPTVPWLSSSDPICCSV